MEVRRVRYKIQKPKVSCIYSRCVRCKVNLCDYKVKNSTLKVCFEYGNQDLDRYEHVSFIDT